MKYNRIYILGTGGAGKTYLAKNISTRLGVPCYHLDDIFWIKKYSKHRKEAYLVKKLDEISKRKRWVMEGAYASWTSAAVRRADIVIWLYPNEFLMCWRFLVRYVKRNLQKTGNDESLRDLFMAMKLILGYRFVKRGEVNKTGYEKHKDLILKHKVDFILIKDKRQLKYFISTIY